MISEKNVLQNEKAMNAKKAVIPVGLKLTEVGAIPEEWNICQLEDLGTSSSPAIKAGPFGSSLTKSIYVKSGYKVYGQEQVIKGNHEYGDYFISDDKFRQLKSCEVIENDILLSLVGTAGKLLVIPKNSAKGIINPRLLRFRFDKEKIDSFFFKFLFEDRAIQELLAANAQGGTMAVLNASILKRLKIPLPSLKEQKAIASVLSDTDALITTLEQLISKKKSIKTASMQQLLTGRTRLPQFTKHPDGTRKGYKTSELGRVPEDWTVLTYGQIFDFLSTSTNARSDLSHDGEYGYIHYGDIHTKWNNKLDASAVELPKISRKLVCSSFLENGDVIMADASEDYNGIGKSIEICNISNKKIVAGLHTYLLRDKYKQLSDGYRGYLHSNANVKKIIEQLATGMKVFGISKNNLLSVPVPVPSKQEQTAIATILSDMDAELEALEQKLAKVRDIKQGMMQQLLTGRIRLPLEQQP
ncbi:restriction endonuclease subunit S [Enterobacter hormaechei]|nr:restriction endonuclease subunit S [Enterobacter hormaechei]